MDVSTLTLFNPPKVSPMWEPKDHLGALRVRLSLGRNQYRVDPGLYRLGNPGKESEVLVTSNYKLSFDLLRRSLRGTDAWILVLQTYGINVWCAAGKGTFGTSELIRQIQETQLQLFVSHKRLILPQLGAPGVSAYKVKDATGFHVKFGPVRSDDLPNYLDANYRKDQNMRSVKFGFRDRLILAPVEIMNSLKYLLIAVLLMLFISGLNSTGYAIRELGNEGILFAILVIVSYLSGALVAPLLLPWIPFRQFGGKGLVVGLLSAGIIVILSHQNIPAIAIPGMFLLSGAIASFLAMNFTGASTYTSLSGVRKEMRLFVPLQLLLVFTGLILIILSQMI